MSSTKMTMIFNQKSLVVPNSNSTPRLKTLNEPVANSKPANTNQKRAKTVLSLGNIMHMSVNSTPCKACGS
jgi:hypothetical protein